MKKYLVMAWFLIKQRVIGFKIPDNPHMDQEGTALFKDLLAKTNVYLEFGTGGSTLEAVKAGVDIIGVESDPIWAQALRKKIAGYPRAVVLDAPLGLTGPWGRPFFDKPTEERVDRWMRYSGVAFDYIGEKGKSFPDVIFVDGRFRRACALDSAARARDAGAATVIIVDDYIGRPHYHNLTEYLGTAEICGRSALFRTPLGEGLKPITPALIRDAFRDCD